MLYAYIVLSFLTSREVWQVTNGDLADVAYPVKKFFYFDGTTRLPYSIDLLIDDTPLTYEEYISFDSSNTPYFHGFYEIMIIQSDDIRMQINEKSYILKRNDLIIFSPQDFHRVIVEEGQTYERWSCEFSKEYIQSFVTENDCILRCFLAQNGQYCHVRHLDDATARQLIHTLADMREKKALSEYGSDVLVQCAMVRVLVWINQLFDVLPPHEGGQVVNDYHKLSPVLNYINTNISADLSLETLSEKFYISKYHLCRIFKKTFGYTVNEYITYRRVVHAAALLRNGSSVMSACEAVTPEGLSHFITLFKKLVGTTPKQYAKQYQD